LALGLSALHGVFAKWVKDFAADRNQRSQRFYRVVNEVPTVLMVAIVILAVVKPFAG
jgi:putative membrane protein